LARSGELSGVIGRTGPSEGDACLYRASRFWIVTLVHRVARTPLIVRARHQKAGELDVTAYVNLYAIAGVLTRFGVVEYWGWWQTHHRCPSCGYCPAWCRCGERTHRHSH